MNIFELLKEWNSCERSLGDVGRYMHEHQIEEQSFSDFKFKYYWARQSNLDDIGLAARVKGIEREAKMKDKELEQYIEENPNLHKSVNLSGHWMTDEDYEELAEAIQDNCRENEDN